MKILLIRLSSLGDIILTSPGITAIRDAAPGAKIDFLTYSGFDAAISHNPMLHRMIILPKKELIRTLKRFRVIRFLSLLRRFLKQLRTVRYDYIVDLHHVTDSALCALLARGKHRAGLRSQLLTIFFKTRARFPVANTRAQEYAPRLTLRMLIACGLLPRDTLNNPPEITFHPGDEAVRDAQQFLTKHNPGNKTVIGLNPAASRIGKRWPIENFITVGIQLVKLYSCRIWIFGGSTDSTLVSQLCSGIGEAALPVTNLPLETAFALFPNLGLLITNDTAALHAAAAMEVPLIGLFGPSNRKKFAPEGEGCTILSAAPPCSPCQDMIQKRCSNCMERIEVREVLLAARKHLEGGGHK